MNEGREFITKCPSCSTSFRVTSEQISTAGGAVRCGACLRIFQAEDQLVVEAAMPSVDAHQLEVQISEDSVHRHVEVDTGSLDDDALSRGEAENRGLEDAVAENEEIEDNECLQSAVKVSGGEIELSNGDDCSPGQSEQEELPHEHAYPGRLEGNDSHYSKPEPEPETEPEPEPEPELEKLKTGEIEKKYWQDWEDYQFSSQLSDQAGSSGAQESIDDLDDQVEEFAPQVTELISGLDLGDDPESLVGELKPEKRIHPLWFAATVILLVGGAIQYTWFNKNIYAQLPEYRIYYLMVCGKIGCELPVYGNAGELSAKNLLIRTHPHVESALIVDAILENSGNYRQRFPDLRLLFRNIENVPIAARRFSPTDYLAGELRGLRYIPANTEVRFSLEILDPGENALGYSLEVLPRG